MSQSNIKERYRNAKMHGALDEVTANILVSIAKPGMKAACERKAGLGKMVTLHFLKMHLSRY